MLPITLRKRLNDRIASDSLRKLGRHGDLVDFSSNDYLGFSASEEIYNRALAILKENRIQKNGATGSRLLSGNHELFAITESFISNFHKSEAALIYNSGYDANLGFFGSVSQRGDLILYDELCHASIRDGIGMSYARAQKFRHNDANGLSEIILKSKAKYANIYVVTEAVFSMDGDAPDLRMINSICEDNGAYLIVDEAHAVGVTGTGSGLVQELGLEDRIFARVITFGKALGCHGAAVLGSRSLIEYLVNFSRSFIYTTALSPHAVATILAAYEALSQITEAKDPTELTALKSNISIVRTRVNNCELGAFFLPSDSAIHSLIIQGNDRVKELSVFLARNGYDVKPILSPTVPKGRERLRICVHSFNTASEIEQLTGILNKALF
jgi:8-amino-7-oxononanoate synthase